MLLAHPLQLEIQFPIPSSSSSSWHRTSSCTRYVSRFPRIRIPSNPRSLYFPFQFLMLPSTPHLQLDIAFPLQFEFFIMPAYQQLQNEIQFCISISYSSNSYQRTSFCTRYNSRSSAIQILVHHAAYQFRSVAFLPNSKSSSSSCNRVHKIQFAPPPIPIRFHRARYNWQSQVYIVLPWRTNSCMRYNSRFPLAPTPARDTIRVSLQLQFEFIMVAY